MTGHLEAPERSSPLGADPIDLTAGPPPGAPEQLEDVVARLGSLEMVLRTFIERWHDRVPTGPLRLAVEDLTETVDLVERIVDRMTFGPPFDVG